MGVSLTDLNMQVQAVERGLWPTPKASGGSKSTRTRAGALKELARGKNVDLGMVVKLWPTPTANEDAAGRPGSKMQKMLGNHPDIRNSGDGTLSPRWVEWLMGFPDGWTDLSNSETP
jgi:DNA (cytosine-5)-methyltransferase 1